MNRGHRALLRGAAAAVVATFVSLLAHVSAGGAIPHPLFLLGIAAVAWLLCSVLAGRPHRPLATFLAVGMSQFAFHTSFEWLRVPSWSLGGVPGPHRHAVALAAPSGTIDVVTTSFGHDMWLAHVLAAAVTALAIHRGEAALRMLRRPFAALLRFSPVLTPLGVQRLRTPVECRPHRVARDTLRDAVTRRGPPGRSASGTSFVRLAL